MIINNLYKTQKELAQLYIFYIGVMRIFECYLQFFKDCIHEKYLQANFSVYFTNFIWM